MRVTMYFWVTMIPAGDSSRREDARRGSGGNSVDEGWTRMLVLKSLGTAVTLRNKESGKEGLRTSMYGYTGI